MSLLGRQLWLVRHGYRQDYLDPRWPQSASYPLDPPLSANGLLQAEDLVAAFANVRPDHVFVSPYLRTLQTVKPMARMYKLPVKVEAGLGEIHRFNQSSSLSLSPVQREQWLPQIDSTYQSCINPRGIETPSMAMTRAAHCLEQLIGRTEGHLVLITHESPIKGIVKRLIPHTGAVRCSFCGVTELQFNQSGWQLMRNGDVQHLSTPTSKQRFFYDYLRRQMLQRFRR